MITNRTLAYHEAGHAWIAHLKGHEVNQMSASWQFKEGHIHHTDPAGRKVEECLFTARDYSQIALAGVIAEQLLPLAKMYKYPMPHLPPYSHKLYLQSGKADIDNAIRFLIPHFDSLAEVERELGILYKQTARLMLDHWRKVASLASVFLCQGDLDKDVIEKIFTNSRLNIHVEVI